MTENIYLLLCATLVAVVSVLCLQRGCAYQHEENVLTIRCPEPSPRMSPR
jgi:hypothetical protein